jgi:hypothetical protein
LCIGADAKRLHKHNEDLVGMMLTDTAFSRNKTYHTPQDTADRLDYKRMEEVLSAARAAVLAHTAMQR